MTELNWLELFTEICSGKETYLHWGLPEPWVQAELFNSLKNRERDSDWYPFETEIPYATYLPIYKSAHRKVETEGAIKWVDLCAKSDERKEFCWVELKVRRFGETQILGEANKSALDAIKRDVVALIGMDPDLTGITWTNPDQYTATHWFKKLLEPHAEKLPMYSHSFVMAYLQPLGGLNGDFLSETNIREQITKWLDAKNKPQNPRIKYPDLKISVHCSGVASKHSLILVQWERLASATEIVGNSGY